MTIAGIRIDDRLIHGQVCGFWIPYYQVNRILIIDDVIANDDTRKSLLKFGCPQGVALSILTVESACEKLMRGLDKGIKVMILCDSPKALSDLYDKGYKFEEINVGNLSRVKDSEQLRTTVYLSEENKRYFKRLAEKKVKLFCQMSPSDSKYDFTEDIRKM